MNGSAPRVRGTVCVPIDRKFVLRFSPACAGNRHDAEKPVNSETVQPRVCGEQATTK